MRYFEGYYIKCLGKEDAIAFIFGQAVCKKERYSFIQVITKDNSYYIKYSNAYFEADKRKFAIKIGPNYANENRLHLDIESQNITIKGEVKFGSFQRLKYNAMGPFKFLPFLECFHTVISMQHAVFGQIQINGRTYHLDGGSGYIEGDRGRSFPKKYFWTQCHIPHENKKPISVFASCAKIPYLGLRFTGTVCIIHFKGQEFRLATYLGAQVKTFSQNKLIIQQGKRKRRYVLEIEVLDTKNARSLWAPTHGKMNRIVEESIERRVRYKFSKGSHILFDVINDRAAYEYSNLT